MRHHLPAPAPDCCWEIALLSETQQQFAWEEMLKTVDRLDHAESLGLGDYGK